MKRAWTPDDESTMARNATEVFTRPIGSRFIARDAHGNEVTLAVVESSHCAGCWYNANSRRCGGNYRECGLCTKIYRADSTSVHFVAVRGAL